MKKRYKLIYEDDDKLKGSYSGIPAKDDPALIDVAVLDGSEPVKPEPKPVPTPAPEPIDNAASIQALKTALEEVAMSDGVSESFDEEFEFDHCDASLFNEMWGAMDFESMNKFMGVEGFYLKYEGVMSMRVDNMFGANSENSADIMLGLPPVRHGISIETDVETGDNAVVPDISGFEFTGKVILRYPGE